MSRRLQRPSKPPAKPATGVVVPELRRGQIRPVPPSKPPPSPLAVLSTLALAVAVAWFAKRLFLDADKAASDLAMNALCALLGFALRGGSPRA